MRLAVELYDAEAVFIELYLERRQPFKYVMNFGRLAFTLTELHGTRNWRMMEECGGGEEEEDPTRIGRYAQFLTHFGHILYSARIFFHT